jgi:hypothetical protein
MPSYMLAKARLASRPSNEMLSFIS